MNGNSCIEYVFYRFKLVSVNTQHAHININMVKCFIGDIGCFAGLSTPLCPFTIYCMHAYGSKCKVKSHKNKQTKATKNECRDFEFQSRWSTKTVTPAIIDSHTHKYLCLIFV